MKNFIKDLFEDRDAVEKVFVVFMILLVFILALFALMLLRVLFSPWEVL